MPQSYVLPSKKRIESKRKLADAMSQEGMNYAPVQSWTQGAARLAQALGGATTDYRVNQMEDERQGALADAIKNNMSVEDMQRMGLGSGDLTMEDVIGHNLKQQQMRQAQASLDSENEMRRKAYELNAQEFAWKQRQPVEMDPTKNYFQPGDAPPVQGGPQDITPTPVQGAPLPAQAAPAQQGPAGMRQIQQGRRAPPKTIDLKRRADAQEDVNRWNANLSDMREAYELAPNVDFGALAEARTYVGTANVPGAETLVGWMGGSPEQAAATQRWQQLAQGQALKVMSDELKGSTAYQEAQMYINVIADPKALPANKQQALGSLIRLTEGFRDAKLGLLQQIDAENGVAPPAPPAAAPPPPAQADDPIAEAREAIAKGANRDAVFQRLREEGIDPALVDAQ